MPKQNFNSGSNKEGPHRQGEKGGKGGTLSKKGSGEAMKSGKSGLGAGSETGGESGGKATGGTERSQKNSPRGKGSGNR